MKIIFDLDHTLLNTALLKKNIFEILQKNGSTRDKTEKTYKKYIMEVCGNYDFKSHAEILEKECKNFDKKQALHEFLKLDKNDFIKYVDTETFQTLDIMKKRKIELALLTKGSREFQTKKIKFSGLEDFFDKIVICQNDKISAMKKIDPREGDFFVNDYWEETKTIKEQFPLLKYFLFRKYDAKKLRRNAKIDIPSVYSVKEILKALPEKN